VQYFHTKSEGKALPHRPENFVYEPGQGICCTISGASIAVGNRRLFAAKNYDLGVLPVERSDASEVVVGRDNTILGIVYLADLLRSEAKQAVADLASIGIKSVLLTGDARPIAESIAAQLQVAEIRAEVLPADKQAYIKELAASGRRVAMVGDGVNDAPALMEASVGVAIGSGTDVARESADVVLIGNDLGRFVETVRIARRCKRIIMTNFVGTLAVDGLGVLLAAFGCLSPLLAAFIHVSSELVFILNSARLLPAAQANGQLKKAEP
jgi:P-type E1-E2 ATPase